MEEIEEPSEKQSMVIAGLNIAVLIGYTIYLGFIDHGQYKSIGLAFLIAIHVALCLILAIFIYHKEFLLSAGLVLIIGFSTCVLAF